MCSNPSILWSVLLKLLQTHQHISERRAAFSWTYPRIVRIRFLHRLSIKQSQFQDSPHYLQSRAQCWVRKSKLPEDSYETKEEEAHSRRDEKRSSDMHRSFMLSNITQGEFVRIYFSNTIKHKNTWMTDIYKPRFISIINQSKQLPHNGLIKQLCVSESFHSAHFELLCPISLKKQYCQSHSPFCNHTANIHAFL